MDLKRCRNSAVLEYFIAVLYSRRKENSRQSSLVSSLNVKGQHTTRFQREKESGAHSAYPWKFMWEGSDCVGADGRRSREVRMGREPKILMGARSCVTQSACTLSDFILCLYFLIAKRGDPLGLVLSRGAAAAFPMETTPTSSAATPTMTTGDGDSPPAKALAEDYGLYWTVQQKIDDLLQRSERNIMPKHPEFATY
ncbi:Os11g0302600 [Oryza sativa Japonica Group]|uniref:Os11g0302600 protein n=1 Tax=Oryza sativa subsp. japonica TaxID=39947 RepID=C7J8S9_ORYSJ|nr:Os11g0302600 [Oryza sativa Japonica Group]|eukprot:NP_001176490.1 Os11g0302600 [Oryza sativa Japonica Group]